jgi:hypothetical protein
MTLDAKAAAGRGLIWMPPIRPELSKLRMPDRSNQTSEQMAEISCTSVETVSDSRHERQLDRCMRVESENRIAVPFCEAAQDGCRVG